MRYDLWRVTEPQHQHAVDRIAETLVAKIDDRYEVDLSSPKPAINFAYLSSGRERLSGRQKGMIEESS
jgi:hypothetical protein